MRCRAKRNGWQMVSAGAKRRKVIGVSHHMEMMNSFAVLEGTEEEREKTVNEEVRTKGADDFSFPAGKMMVVSQVKHFDSAFCSKDRKRRTR
ncbi:hypothetical protein E2C01_060217 [Portunus trituberculatus]|uniref:Uncharacterized protein n=1 Tax=Portunus trituberculatus TaxID=210409 RepID=A0A5B7H7G2_PORTR|nr:hypothetical protein [Portunus trituberculatus]